MALSSSPRHGNASSPNRLSFLPPPRQSSALSLGSAINLTSHTAVAPLLAESGAASSTVGFQHSRSSRQLFSSPPSPSMDTTSASAPNIITPTMQSAGTSRPRGSGAGPGAGATSEQNTHEKMWAEMQQKLEEVELNADHVFGSSHAKSLEGLRTAQVELAQAWMRSEEDELDNRHSEFGKKVFAGAAIPPPTRRDAGFFEMVDDVENDVLLARKRRVANDEHFGKVAMSVVDVTQKLESVAKAMAGVELESRSIWAGSSDSESS